MSEEMVNLEADFENKPFVIRGHHLDIFAELLYTQEEMEEVKGFLDARELAANRLVDDLCTNLGLKDKSDITYYGRTYRQDVLGSTNEDLDLFSSKCLKVMKDFLLLPDEYLVEIVVQKPDAICDCCVFGNHCSESSNGDAIILKKYFGPADLDFTLTLGELREILLDAHARLFPELHDWKIKRMEFKQILNRITL